jgi:ATP-binding cassette subfamily C protein CydD
MTSAAQATAVIDEVERVGAYVERYLPARTAAAVVPVVLLVAVFPASWLVGVLLVLCLPLPAINLSIVGMGTAAVARERAAELRHLAGYFLDRLRGLATLRALGAEQAEFVRVRLASDRLQASSMAVLRVAFVSAAVLEAIVTVAVAVIASYIGLTLLGYVHIPGLPTHMSLRDGLFLLMVTPLYFQPIRNLAAAYHERAEAFAAIEALTPLLADCQAVDRPSVLSAQLDRPPAVAMRDVGVSFAGREVPALSGITLSVSAGELVGISGPSGAGKSTLLRLIAGDLDPSEGSVTIDETPAVGVVRTSVTWLGQRPYLFSGTLADNIRLGRENLGADAVLAAALNAGLEGVLDRIDDGLETRVGEGGWGLSGGEAHRISLARTFLSPSPLLLLDEPTAHLDAETESAIIDTITELARRATTIVVTHSPALLAVCDRVLALDRGRLVEPGLAAVLSGAAT